MASIFPGVAVSATCIILDCDGVLVDSELISARIAAACFAGAGAAISMEEILARFTGMKATDVSATVFAERGLAVPERVTEQRLEATMAAFEQELRPMPGVDEALAAIHALKCVASSSHHDRIALALRVTGLARHFGNAVFSATMVERGKPAPDLFLHAAKAMGAEPAHCIVVEDSVAGVVAGKAAGMAVIGFTGGSHCGPDHRHALVTAGADRVIHHMSELAQAVLFERSIHRI
ncbi:MAG: HAD family hydrolase [Bauldia sp.]|nr:HAD family hydrolase [Bauldia sp.]MCW5718638.1 HAD family hydrolase [Bauldia sp.]